MAPNNEIEEFDSIEGSGQGSTVLNLSNIYSIKLGGFGDQSNLRTYLGSIRVKDLKEDLDLYETLTKDKSWPVSQIIQREVDKIRVSNIAKSYIQGQGRIVKYFPPIIVAILPKDSDGKISMTLDYESEVPNDIRELIYQKSMYSTNDPIKKYILNGENLSLIDGVYLIEVSKVFDTNLLAWNKDKYYSIVIDGQHRLQALFKSAISKPEVNEYLQDVVFVDFSPLILSNTSLSPVEVVRRVFVDINTNARKVGFVRQILMDDKELASLCVQSLVDSVNRDGSEKDIDSFLISQIVDWYGDKLKHSLPHLTGILSLYQIIDDYLIQENISSLNDLRSPRKVSKWVNRLNDVFMVDRFIDSSEDPAIQDIKTLYTSLMEYEARRSGQEDFSPEIDDEYKESEIFNFDYRILDIAQSQFEAIYLKPLVSFFNNYSPLNKGIGIIRDKGGLGTDENLSTALISSLSKVANTEVLKNAISHLKAEMERELYPKYFLLYTVLGQKSVFNVLFKRIQQDLNPDMDESICMGIVDSFLVDINNLITYIEQKPISLFSKNDDVIIEEIPTNLLDLGVIASSFWEGVNYENSSIIYNSQGIGTMTFIISELIRLNNSRINADTLSFDIGQAPWVKSRIKRILRKRFAYTPDLADEFANEIIKLKSEFIERYFSS
jgi:hypothetical protein